MTVTVIVINAANTGLARMLLPPTNTSTEGAGRCYFCYTTDGTGEFCHSFVDPFDGEPLIEMTRFPSVDAAAAWVMQDIALRTIQVEGVQ